MKIVSEAKFLTIEPTTNGVIVYSTSNTDIAADYNFSAEEKHVFTNMADLFTFIQSNFIGETKTTGQVLFNTSSPGDNINPYSVDGPIYGGGS